MLVSIVILDELLFICKKHSYVALFLCQRVWVLKQSRLSRMLLWWKGMVWSTSRGLRIGVLTSKKAEAEVQKQNFQANQFVSSIFWYLFLSYGSCPCSLWFSGSSVL